MGNKKYYFIRNYPQHRHRQGFVSKQFLIYKISIFLLVGLLAGFWCWQSFGLAQVNATATNISQSQSLPLPRFHPLPLSLANWQDETNSGDYFQQVKTTNAGYLVWSKFPVITYIQTPANLSPERAEDWVKSITKTVAEWQAYIPIEITSTAELADITIIRKVPPLQTKPLRARSALASYSLYIKDNVLRHKFTILLSPSLSGKSLQASSRHELGHALGIWGHSSLPTDALYFSQVANPPQISPRDVNTLKKVYQQPTSLGWKLTKSEIKEGENIR